MDTDRFLRISDIFHEALDAAPEERSRFLDDACGDDAELRREVEALLAEEEEPSLPDMQQRSLLDTNPFGTVDAEHPIDQQLGPYKVIRCLGEGGMGRVYLAERTADFEQLVAIKIARPGRLDEISLSRFRDEIKFLAALSQHSQIAGILDAGTTPDGRPYLVMEYVDGMQIDEYCNKRSLSLADRLRLFQSVCRAVEFAHQHALIHRDIKPGNILVTADGTATLIDFGIAKLQQPNERVASTSATQTIYRALTPHYASPEQIRGELSTISSDVYSLGVVLYELLTGARPFELTTTSAAEMERIVCEQDPESPSKRVRTLTPQTFQDLETNDQWRRKVSGDLDNIVMMCLRKEPDRRYQSVRDLSDDIERHLTNLPVSARQITSLDRTWRWCKRNPLVTMLSTALILSLIAGLFGVGAQWRRAEHNAANAQAAATLANNAAEAERKERLKAQKAETLAAKSAAEAAASAEEAKLQAESAEEVTDFLIGIFQGADPLGVRGYQFGPPPDATTNPTARELLERGLKMIETELQNEPQIQATIKRAIAETYVSLGDLPQAEILASSALEIQRNLYGATPHVKTAEALTTIATVRYFQGNYEAAIPPYRESVEMLDALYGEMDPRGATNKLFFAFIVLESNLNGEGNSEGERLINQVFEIRKAQPDPPPQHLALALIGKAIISRVRRRPAEAKAALMQAGLVLAGDPATGAVYGKLALTAVSATLNWQFGRTAAAADETQEVIKSMKATLGQYHPVVTHLQLDLSRRMIAADPKRPERGLELMQEAVNSCQVAYGRQPRTALALKLYGEQLLKVDAIEAEKHLRESVDIYVEILGDENVRTQRAVKLHAQALDKTRGEESSD